MTTSSLFNWLIVLQGIFVFIVISLIYSRSSFRWKANPKIPYFFGVTLLFLAFIADVYLMYMSDQMKLPLGETSKKFSRELIQFFFDNQKSYEFQSKFIEIVFIPIAISLILLGITGKADSDMEQEKLGTKEFADRYNKRVEQYKMHSQNLAERVRNGERGQVMIDDFDKLQYESIDIMEMRFDLRKSLDQINSKSFTKEISDFTGI